MKRPANLASSEVPDAVQEAARDITNDFPGEVLGIGDDELLMRASVKVQEPYRQPGGQRPLYGEIAGYRLAQAPGVSARLDIEGRHLDTARQEFAPATSILGVCSKMVAVRIDGALEADAAKKQPR